LLRGKGKLKSKKNKPLIVNISFLNLLPPRSKVDINLLVKHRLVDEKEAKKYGVKILGGGEIGHPLVVSLSCSQGANKKIEKAGGKVVIMKSRKSKVRSPKRTVKSPKSKNKSKKKI